MSNYIEFQEHERISWRLPTGIIVFVFIIVIGFVVREVPEYSFEIPVQEMKAQLTKPAENTVNLKKVASIINTEDKNYQFIDIRSPHDFIKGHIPGAINIPIHKLLDEEYKEILNPAEGKTNVLYYTEHAGACAPWMLLYQMGYKNNKIMVGGYQIVKENIIDKNNVQGIDPYDEKAKYDYADIAAKTKGASSAAPVKTAAPVPVVKKRKKGAVEGGC